jgi:fructoselysine 3-epimerase
LEGYLDTLGDYNYNRALTLEFTSSQYLRDPNEAIEKSLQCLAPYLV